MKRRNFIRNAGLAVGALATPAGRLSPVSATVDYSGQGAIRIQEVASDFEREHLIRPFGFKGGYMKEIWQTAAMIKTGAGASKIGICTQNVLWSDPRVFERNSESAGNALMYAVTERALQMIRGESFDDPVSLQEGLLDELHRYSKSITNNPDLKETFTLNALVGVDNALWLAYCAEKGISRFDDMIPVAYRPSLSWRHDKVACVPLMSYSIPVSEIKAEADQGYFFMKIKIGQPGTEQEMLEKDMKRLSEIHAAIGHLRTSHTESGKIPYYFDANGRYRTREAMFRLLDHARKIGALEQIMIIEEPFAEEMEFDVSDLGVRIVSDETSHTDKHALERIQMGYRAIALKPIAKTMSMSMKVAQLAHEKGVPCFCADLTVNPILVEWNKNVAARLAPFPGIKGGMGLLETNGHQNYANWKTMESYNPSAEAAWTRVREGIFNLKDEYYEKSGGIFLESAHYRGWFD